MAPPPDREAEARKEAGVGIGLADDLRHVRTALVKAHLAGDFIAAFDLMLFQMGRSVFTFGYKADALHITVRETADRPNVRMNDEDFAAWSPGEAMLADRSGLPLDWLEIEDDGESFAALRALPVADKKALFAACVARTVKPQLAFEPQARPELEATVARLAPDTVRLVYAWLDRAGIGDGRLFRSVGKGGRIGERLHPCQVPRIFKAMAREAGLPEAVAGGLSGHSARVGAAQDMVAAGIELPAILNAGRWKSTAMVNRYGERLLARRSGAAQLARMQKRA